MYIYVYFSALRTRVKSIGPENNIVVTGCERKSFFSFLSPPSPLFRRTQEHGAELPRSRLGRFRSLGDEATETVRRFINAILPAIAISIIAHSRASVPFLARFPRDRRPCLHPRSFSPFPPFFAAYMYIYIYMSLKHVRSMCDYAFTIRIFVSI